MKKYVIILEKDGKSEGRYKVDRELFMELKSKIKPFRSGSVQPKAIRCIETGEIFKCAAEAQTWAYNQGLTPSMNHLAIRSVCKGQKDSVYGYHWEYVK